FHEVAEHAFFVVADRLFQRYGHANRALDLLDLLRTHFHGLGDLLQFRIAAETLGEAHHLAVVAADALVHVDRHADSAGLIRDRARHCLADPPRRVGGKLESSPPVELLYRAHETGIAFLNEVEQAHAVTKILLGYADDESQVGFDHLATRLIAGVVVTP